MSSRILLAALCTAPLLTACRTGSNYTSPGGPAYAGQPGSLVSCDGGAGRTLRVVSFNVEFALRPDTAARVLGSTSELQCADVILLQEMDEQGTRRIAEHLGLQYVYYPAVFHYRYDRDFGNAVLSRWPVREQSKLVLPHVSLFTRTQRIAVAVTLDVRGRPLRVYSAHLGSLLEITPWARKAQLRAVLDDASPYERVVIGGDMNSGGVGEVAAEAGFSWPTQEGPPTVKRMRWDHIFLRGVSSVGAGTVLEIREASDHRPVWVEMLWPEG
ncbi:MAG: endonuclease/exonuclease/phosphatase family protein [Gemmatimonadota bacterium]